MMNKKVLFVCLHRPDRSPSQRFRFEQYIDYLNKNGFSCRHTYLLNAKRDQYFYAKGKIFNKFIIVLHSMLLLIKEVYFSRYDIVFVQREAFMLGTAFFEKQFARRAKLIFDFDDSIWRVQTGKIKSSNKGFYFLKNPEKTRDIIKHADLVFAGNDYLKQYAQKFNSNIEIIPTTIDTEEYFHLQKTENKQICIGWSGSFSTIIHFEYITDILKILKEKYGDAIIFKVIGDPNYSNSELNIQGIPWNKQSEIEDLSEIDIGIMPLPDDEWTKGKCGLKGLQYMALGIPTVMSPIGVNEEIITDGINGFLAANNDEWIEKLSILIDSYDLRMKIGLEGRKTVVEKYSVEANKNKYLHHFNELLTP